MVDFLLLLWEKKDFDCVIENLVLNPALIYLKMNRGSHDIPLVLGWRTLGWNNFPSQPFSFISHNTMLLLRR